MALRRDVWNTYGTDSRGWFCQVRRQKYGWRLRTRSWHGDKWVVKSINDVDGEALFHIAQAAQGERSE